MKLTKQSKVERILVITLSNIGDVILTFPVIDTLKNDFPEATVSVVVGPKACSLFEFNSNFYKVHVFNKHQEFGDKLVWALGLRNEKFDVVVDLRNSAIPFLLGAKYKTPLQWPWQPVLHMRQKHLNRLRTVYEYEEESGVRFGLSVTDKVKEKVDRALGAYLSRNPFVVVAPGAADQAKRWDQERFAQLCEEIIKKYRVNIVFVGDDVDHKIVDDIQSKMSVKTLNLAGQTSLVELAGVLKRSMMAIVNDSGISHMASYLDLPVLSLFGPTDPAKYGPWSSHCRSIRKNKLCRKCHNPKLNEECSCMSYIYPEDVLNTFRIQNGTVEFI